MATFQRCIVASALFCALAFMSDVAQAADPLPSWNDGSTKQSILSFVAKVARPGSPEFVSPAERIATLDDDGTPAGVQVWEILSRGRAPTDVTTAAGGC
jgi:hypothetical protein